MTSEIRVVIVDDEPAARTRLRKLVARHVGAVVVGECRNGAEALAEIARRDVDLVFLDVQMPGMDGFTVLSQLDLRTLPLVVFVTAYDRYALRAFEVNALDYLMKPFSDERFEETMTRVRARLRDRASSDLTDRIAALLKRDERSPASGATPSPSSSDDGVVVIRDGGSHHALCERDILWVASAGNYVELHLVGRHLLHRETLTSLSGELSAERFLRIHRRWLVNVERIANVRYMADGRYRFELTDGTALTSSRSFRDGVVKFLQRNASATSRVDS